MGSAAPTTTTSPSSVPTFPSPTSSPSLRPTPQPTPSCHLEDNPGYRYWGGKNCVEHIDSNNPVTKCNKTQTKTKYNGSGIELEVYKWCPETCGEKAGLGECAFLFTG